MIRCRSRQDATTSGAPAAETFYQLTHDYLVPSLRQWLSRKQRQTRRGRAELQLASTTALWCDRPDSRRLPSLSEWLKILVFTRKRTWTSDERRMMKRATRHFVLRAAAALADRRGRHLRDRGHAEPASEHTTPWTQRCGPTIRACRNRLPSFAPIAALLRPDLERIEKSDRTSSQDREVATLALYGDRPTAEPRRVPVGPASGGPARPCEPDRRCFRGASGRSRRSKPAAACCSTLSAEPAARLRVACVLARLEPSSADSMRAFAASSGRGAHHRAAATCSRWIELLGPVSGLLDPHLREICGDLGRDTRAQSTAAEALAVILQREDQPGDAGAVDGGCDARGVAGAVAGTGAVGPVDGVA